MAYSQDDQIDGPMIVSEFDQAVTCVIVLLFERPGNKKCLKFILFC